MNHFFRLPLVMIIIALAWEAQALAGSNSMVIADFENASGMPPEGWELVETAGQPDLTYVEDRDGRALRLHSHESSFGIQKSIHVDLTQTPYLVWEWKVTHIPDDGHFKVSSRDDQAAQLIFSFSEELFGTQEILSYIWGSSTSPDTMGDAAAGDDIPFLEIKAVVVESGPKKLGRWITESRNIVEDYQKLFGEKPTKATGVRIQINSQHTDAVAESLWKRIRFQSTPPSANQP